MNSSNKIAFSLFFLAGALTLLPACGKSTVKSQKPPETLLTTQITPVVTPVPEGPELALSQEPAAVAEPSPKEEADETITEEVESAPQAQAPKVVAQAAPSQPAPLQEKPAPAAAPAPDKTEAPVKAKGAGYDWLWGVLLLAIAGVGWYFLAKGHSHPAGQPHPKPPTGGLSPVSGFTGFQNEKGSKIRKKPSIWSKKIF